MLTPRHVIARDADISKVMNDKDAKKQVLLNLEHVFI
jgi:hypothetical protein